jgi:hypothetical protein
MHGSWNKCVNHICCTFVFRGDTKAKTKVQQRSLTPLLHDLHICKQYALNTYGFHMCRLLPPVEGRVVTEIRTAGAGDASCAWKVKRQCAFTEGKYVQLELRHQAAKRSCGERAVCWAKSARTVLRLAAGSGKVEGSNL